MEAVASTRVNILRASSASVFITSLPNLQYIFHLTNERFAMLIFLSAATVSDVFCWMNNSCHRCHFISSSSFRDFKIVHFAEMRNEKFMYQISNFPLYLCKFHEHEHVLSEANRKCLKCLKSETFCRSRKWSQGSFKNIEKTEIFWNKTSYTKHMHRHQKKSKK